MKLIARTLNQVDSPIVSSEILVLSRNKNLPLLDASQGVPSYQPYKKITNHVKKIASQRNGAYYTERMGIPSVRHDIAESLSNYYGGLIKPENILMTGGCNQAFSMSILCAADVGEKVMIQTPFYFNHDMWLKLNHVIPVYLPPDEKFMPSVNDAARLLTEDTKAIILVTPGNPTGVALPPGLIHEFADFAKRHELILILDETYKRFSEKGGPPHELFQRQDWGDYLISLQSFSKELAIPGYRVGAMIGNERVLNEAMKVLDCIAICAPRLGQEAAQVGLTTGTLWYEKKIAEIAKKHHFFRQKMEGAPGGFSLRSSGAFFGWVKHPFSGISSAEIATELVRQQSVLCIPGHLFTPEDESFLRFSFANLSLKQIAELSRRLSKFQMNGTF
jgi:aspartate/methionine/tyrosine aminotransferase